MLLSEESQILTYILDEKQKLEFAKKTQNASLQNSYQTAQTKLKTEILEIVNIMIFHIKVSILWY